MYKKIISVMLTVALSLSILVSCGKKDDTVSITMSYYLTTPIPSGQTATDNLWTRAIRDELGYNISFKFATTNEAYSKAINGAISIGDIPHIFTASINQLPTLVKANMIYPDLTDAYDKNATPLTKQLMGWDNDLKQNSPNFKGVTIDGKLIAIPWTESKTDSSEIMYIRKDWLQAVNADIPTTIDELEEVLRKFKNYKPQSIGILAQNMLYKNAGSLSAIFNAYGAYPEIFVKKNAGTQNEYLDYGMMQPEMIPAINKLAEWYNKGYVFNQFETYKQEDIGSFIANGDCGIWFGTQSLPLWNMNSAVVNTPGADWVVAPIPSATSQKAKTTFTNPITNYHVVRRNFDKPEMLINMINLFTEKMWGENANFEVYDKISSLAPFQVWPAQKNLLAGDMVSKTIKENAPNYAESGSAYDKMDSEQKTYYNYAAKYLKDGSIGDGGRNWAYTRIFGRHQDDNSPYDLFYRQDDDICSQNDIKKGYESSQSIAQYYYKNNLYVEESFVGIDTESMVLYRKQIESDMRTAVLNSITKMDNCEAFNKTTSALRASSRTGYAKKVLDEINTLIYHKVPDVRK